MNFLGKDQNETGEYKALTRSSLENKRKGKGKCLSERFTCIKPFKKVDRLSIKEEFLPLVDFLENTRDMTINLLRNIIKLVSGKNEKDVFVQCYNIHNDDSCKIINIYPFNLFQHISQYIEAIRSGNILEHKFLILDSFFEIMYSFLDRLLTNIDQDIDKLEIHFLTSDKKRVTISNFINYEHQIEFLVLEYLNRMNDVVSALDFGPYLKKNSPEKQEIKKILRKGIKIFKSKMGKIYQEGAITFSQEQEEFKTDIFNDLTIITPDFEFDSQNYSDSTAREMYLPTESMKNFINHSSTLSLENGRDEHTANYFFVGLGIAVVSTMFFGILLFVFNIFMKNRTKEESRRENDRIFLLEEFNSRNI